MSSKTKSVDKNPQKQLLYAEKKDRLNAWSHIFYRTQKKSLYAQTMHTHSAMLFEHPSPSIASPFVWKSTLPILSSPNVNAFPSTTTTQLDISS